VRMRFPALCLSFALAVTATTPPPVLGMELPSIGDAARGALSPEQEREIGEAFMRHVRKHMRVVDDPQINEYLRSLGYQLVAHSDAQTQEFTFFIVEDNTINAFAAPGGFIGINSGLLLATETESELAAVLAHEIAHVTQRHIARAYEAAGRMNVPMAAAVLAAILIGSRGGGQVGEAAIAAATAGSAQYQINFTRAHEQEADRIGMRILARAGFDPFSMPAFFRRMQQNSRYYGSAPELLRTHPVTTNRIADALGRAETLPRNRSTDGPGYHITRARLLALTEEDPSKAAEVFEQRIEGRHYRSESAERYGYALAQLRAGRYEQARDALEDLLAADPDRIAYLVLSADLERAAGNIAEAMRVYSRALELYPHNYPLTVHYAEMLLGAEQPHEALRLLRDYNRTREATAEIYRLLARAAGAAGALTEGHRAMAEFHYLNGQTETAIEQLSLALRSASDFYESSRIEARLQQLREEAAQEAASRR
jgi:beta-barrel assembly-enhancing protease